MTRTSSQYYALLTSQITHALRIKARSLKDLLDVVKATVAPGAFLHEIESCVLQMNCEGITTIRRDAKVVLLK